MKILVVNDDGIESRGIYELVRALHEDAGAEVYVVAPDGQRSAASHAITLLTPIDAWPVEFEGAEMAFAISGLPADCVAVGVKIMKDKGIDIDMVFAGINHGSNIGTDTIYSGTVGAAMEGSIYGYPSVAVSVDSHKPQHFKYACELAVDTIKKTGGKWDPKVTVNINTPDLPAEEIKGVRYTVIGEREYTNDIKHNDTKHDGRRGDVCSYIYGGEPVKYDDKSLIYDVIAIQEGYASITPLHKDWTAGFAIEEMKNWRLGK